ncbi:ran-binding protein 9/10 [Anaeramoeba flamelloides]|uniref:Ran-binding protein 9/10 n=1 Tax=Anaeramoeba flamelloides TaxID=1746091 RepID=A0AAV7Z3L4_9EUKA|nr:ran-binding protein 9/10 [Anaeramoeba flamelloides]
MKEHTNLYPPTKLYLDPEQKFLKLIDPLTFEYVARSRNRTKDVGTIQTNCPLVTDVRFNYFEIKIVCWGIEGAMAIGLTPYNYDLFQMPGWVGKSWAFHQDDGHKFHNSGSGKDYTTPSKEGDTVGLLYDRHLSTITFTRNGKLLPLAFENVSRCLLYPSIGSHTDGEKARINLTGPFVFNFQRYKEKFNLKNILKKQLLTFTYQVSENKKQVSCQKNEEHEKKQKVILMIIRNFLIKRNYLKTLKALKKDTNFTELFSTTNYRRPNKNKNSNSFMGAENEKVNENENEKQKEKENENENENENEKEKGKGKGKENEKGNKKEKEINKNEIDPQIQKDHQNEFLPLGSQDSSKKEKINNYKQFIGNLKRKNQIIQLIKEGNSKLAIEKIKQFFPQILITKKKLMSNEATEEDEQNDKLFAKKIEFTTRIYLQVFIELLKNKKWEESIAYSKNKLNRYLSSNFVSYPLKDLIFHSMSLICQIKKIYPVDEAIEKRVELSFRAAQLIDTHLGFASNCPLETIIKHTLAMDRKIWQSRKGTGLKLSFQDIIN